MAVVEAEKDQDEEVLLGKLADTLWTKHPTDVVLVKSGRARKNKS